MTLVAGKHISEREYKALKQVCTKILNQYPKGQNLDLYKRQALSNLILQARNQKKFDTSMLSKAQPSGLLKEVGCCGGMSWASMNKRTDRAIKAIWKFYAVNTPLLDEMPKLNQGKTNSSLYL